MRAHLMTKEVWGCKGVDVQPDITWKAELKQWCKDRDSAAGEIYLSLESSKRSMSRAWRRSCEDVVETGVHTSPERPATRFNAYDALFRH